MAHFSQKPFLKKFQVRFCILPLRDLGVCGDWCSEPRIEGELPSGNAAAGSVPTRGWACNMIVDLQQKTYNRGTTRNFTVSNLQRSRHRSSRP
jgi:hypothetical protein